MTPTPTIKSITLSDGEVLSDQGVVRPPDEGEWFIDAGGDVRLSITNHRLGKRCTILTPPETQGQKIERRGDWVLPELHGCGITRPPISLNPLIDAACETVNDFQHSSVRHAFIDNLAATLEPFTQAVKEERFWVDGHSLRNEWFVNEWRGGSYVRQIAKFEFKQDAKDFAAYKNSQSEGGE